MLATSWLWLITGVIALAWLAAALVPMLGGSIGPLPGGGLFALVATMYLVVLGLIFVVMPGFLVLFYSNRDVRRTFETRDYIPGWTAGCPLSVLTVSQFIAGGGILLLITPAYSDAIPFFGFSVTGIVARLLPVFGALLSFYLAWTTYKMRVTAWWANVAVTMIGSVWFGMAYWRVDFAESLSRMGIGLQSGETLLGMNLPSGRTITWLCGILGAAWLVFLIRIKKHFK
jgi:hypothetical protein